MLRDVVWAGGAHDFDLKIDHLRALQQKCDCGPEYLMRRLMSQEWRADDVIYTILFGLEGGGMEKDQARKLVADHLEEKVRNLKPAALVAASILMDALLTDPDDPVGEAKAGEERGTLSREASGASQASTNGRQSSSATSGE